MCVNGCKCMWLRVAVCLSAFVYACMDVGVCMCVCAFA